MLKDACWLWTKFREKDGYGLLKIHQRKYYAHRVIYEMFVGPIPPGMQLDHICRQHGCVNPSHLRVCTSRENTLAPGSHSSAARYAARTCCQRGHPFTEANTRYRASKPGKRICRTCERERSRLRSKLRPKKRAGWRLRRRIKRAMLDGAQGLRY